MVIVFRPKCFFREFSIKLPNWALGERKAPLAPRGGVKKLVLKIDEDEQKAPLAPEQKAPHAPRGGVKKLLLKIILDISLKIDVRIDFYCCKLLIIK